MSELEGIASTLSHDIIAINKTWLDLNARHLPAEVSIKGYDLHNVDKPSHSNRAACNEPIRGNNILGLVMTTTDLSINGLEVTDKIGDHQMIDFPLEVQDPNTRTQHKQVLDYKRANFELMKEELGSDKYEVLMNNKNAEECYTILKNKIATATDTISQKSETGQLITLLGSP
ncbi:hypothetical protein FHG87_024641 [Trinorchestia longiramus]|nr:hypothetical protein FHG87_024641 [Trinorchestia longiramus]